MRRTVLLTICAFLVGALAGTGAARQAGTPGAYALSQPSQWVAFSADVLQVNAAGDKSTGRFYRSSDGSTRTEIRINYGSRIGSSIEIMNFSKKAFYRNIGRAEWLTGPLPYDDRALAPRPWSSNAGLQSYPYKLAILKGMDGSLKAEQGLDSWIYSNRTGITRLMVPELNFFPVVDASVSGFRRSYSNIEIGPVDTSLFEPPAAATLEYLKSIMGR